MSETIYNKRLLLYPRPIQAPDIPYQNDRKPNPRLPAWFVVVAAFVMEWIPQIAYLAWKNAGFGSLTKIRELIEDTEPRVDPTIFPVDENHPFSDSKSANHQGTGRSDKLSNGTKNNKNAAKKAIKYNSLAYYRQLYLSGELTPLDVAHAILPLVRRDTSPPGPHSIAWFDVNVHLVIKAAEASTLRYKNKTSLGPLDGVPTAVKDEFDMEGYRTTLGSPNDYTGTELVEGKIDSWCVRKMEEAGMIILGKLSMHEFGMDTSGNNVLFGTPPNPYNSRYYPGGSSSGSAYAVANGLIPVALGSDGGGSIRIPASFCSVFGLKTSHGRISFHPGQNHSNTCGVNGPIAADIESLAAFYKVISQPHHTSYFPLPPPIQNSVQSNTNRPKLIGIPEAWFQRATPAVQTLCRNMIHRLSKQKGYEIVPISIPFLVEGQIAHALTILTDAATLLPKTKGLSAANKVLLALGRVTPSTDYLLAQKLRRVLMQHLAWLWQMYPGMVIVTPTTTCAGWPIRSDGELKYGVSDGDTTLQTMEYVWMANFCGVPSITVPAGYVVPEGADGEGEVAEGVVEGMVPVGLMATGDWCSEEALMSFGLDAEELCTDIVVRPPGWVDIVAIAKQAKGRPVT